MVQSLAASASRGPVAIVAVMFGATRGIFMDAGGCWLFDSHGHPSAHGNGAIVDYTASTSDLGRMLLSEGTAVDDTGEQAQLLVLRQPQL